MKVYNSRYAIPTRLLRFRMDKGVDRFRLHAIFCIGFRLMDGSGQKRLDTLLGNCLNCQGLVRIPATAKASRQVRCPHCSESYFLSQLLKESIPELEIVDNTPVDQTAVSKTDEEAERDVFVVPPQLSKGAKRRRSGRSRERESSSERSRSDQGSSESRSERGSSSSTSRRRKHVTRTPATRNPVMEMLKVIVGGVLAIPIAYMLVFWVFQKDPLNVGPSISNVAPFLVPEEYRGGPDPADDESTESVDGTESDADKTSAVPDRDRDKVLKDIGP